MKIQVLILAIALVQLQPLRANASEELDDAYREITLGEEDMSNGDWAAAAADYGAAANAASGAIEAAANAGDAEGLEDATDAFTYANDMATNLGGGGNAGGFGNEGGG